MFLSEISKSLRLPIATYLEAIISKNLPFQRVQINFKIELR